MRVHGRPIDPQHLDRNDLRRALVRDKTPREWAVSMERHQRARERGIGRSR